MTGTILAIVLGFLKILGPFVDAMDEEKRKKVITAAHDALRIKVEDDVIERGRIAYATSLADPDRVQRERDKPDSKYFRD